jgi:hypothetical protein
MGDTGTGITGDTGETGPTGPAAGDVESLFTDLTSGTASTYSMPGNTLDADNEYIEVVAWGEADSGAVTPRIQFGGTTILTGLSVSSSNEWRITAIIARVGANEQRSIAQHTDMGGGTEVNSTTTTLTKDLTASQDVEVNKMSGGGTLDVQGMIVRKYNAP